MRSEPLVHVDLAFVPSLPSTDNAELSRYMDLHALLLLRVCFVVIIRVDPTCLLGQLPPGTCALERCID